MQHRLMILGSMDEFVELTKLAESRGIYTIVCDGYANGPAKAVADEAVNIDVRDTRAIAAYCQEQGVDGIIASFSDLLAECLVNIADQAGLPCYAKPDQIRYLREKSLMKGMLSELGISAPASAHVHKGSIAADLEAIGFPCVVKPVNGYGSRGVYVVSRVQEVEERFDEITSYSDFDYILAEQYNDGYEFNMMNWIVDGEVVTLSIADREKSSEIPLAVPHVSRIVYPSRLISKVYDDAHAIVQAVANHLGLTEGPLSMQFFYRPGEGVQVCEIAGRLFGYEHELIALASGFSIEELLLNYVYDRDALKQQLASHSPHHPRCSAGHYFHGYEGVIGNTAPAHAAAHIDGVVDAHFYYGEGDRIKHGVGAAPYVLRYYAVASDREAIDAITAQLYESVNVYGENGASLLYSSQMTAYPDA